MSPSSDSVHGQIAQLTLDGRNFELLVSKIHPEVQNAQFEVDLQFSGEAPTGIRRGQTLQMRLVLGDLEEQATLLENGPFFNDTGGAWVFVLDEDQRVAERRRVRFGRRNPNYIEVESGLLPGDHVIVSSYGSFIDVERLYVDG